MTAQKHLPPITSIAAANYLIGLGGNDLTPIKLIKLVYLCHGWHMALGLGPLLAEPVQAWKRGPVLPSLYYAARHHGNSPILGEIFESPNESQPASLSDTSATVMESVYGMYEDMSGNELSELTHLPKTPWAETRKQSKQNAVICNKLIERHFRKLLDALKKQ